MKDLDFVETNPRGQRGTGTGLKRGKRFSGVAQYTLKQAVAIIASQRPLMHPEHIARLVKKYRFNGITDKTLHKVIDIIDGFKKSNPPPKVKIYGRLLRIEAQKTQPHRCDPGCKKANHCYYHDFTSRPQIFGSADGKTLIIKLKGN